MSRRAEGNGGGGGPLFFEVSEKTEVRQGGSNEKVSCILHKGTWNDSRIIVSTKVDAVSARCPNKILLYARHFGLKTDFLHVSADLPNAQSMLVRPFRAEHRPTARKWKTKIHRSPLHPHRNQNSSPPNPWVRFHARHFIFLYHQPNI